MEFGEKELQAIRVDFEEAMKAVEAKHNVKIDLGNMSYTRGSNASAKLTIEAIDEEGVVQSKARLCYLRQGRVYGLKPEWIDQEFTAQNQTFRIDGLASRRRKMPVEVTDVNTGGTYNFPVATIIREMEKLSTS